jgi:hypothetical protein
VPGPPPDSTPEGFAEHQARVRRRLEHGVHVPERGCLRRNSAASA